MSQSGPLGYNSDPATSGGGGSSFDFFTSSVVNTDSTAISAGTFTNFSNSPAFTFTPNFTGTYKVYCSFFAQSSSSATIGVARINNTSGSATLLSESQAAVLNGSAPIAGQIIWSIYVQSVYTLTSGVSYVFDIQGKNNIAWPGSNAQTYVYAQRVA